MIHLKIYLHLVHLLYNLQFYHYYRHSLFSDIQFIWYLIIFFMNLFFLEFFYSYFKFNLFQFYLNRIILEQPGTNVGKRTKA